jgi:ABC-type Co2+ transport system permease subunit
MRAGFVTGAVISGHSGLTVQGQHCLVPFRGRAFSGVAVQRRVRTQPWSAHTPRAAAASCVEVSEDSFESEVLQSVRAKLRPTRTSLHLFV